MVAVSTNVDGESGKCQTRSAQDVLVLSPDKGRLQLLEQWVPSASQGLKSHWLNCRIPGQ